MEQFNELQRRVERLEEVLLELQQRMGMMEQTDQRWRDVAQRASARARRRRAKRGNLESRSGAKSTDN